MPVLQRRRWLLSPAVMVTLTLALFAGAVLVTAPSRALAQHWGAEELVRACFGQDFLGLLPHAPAAPQTQVVQPTQSAPPGSETEISFRLCGGGAHSTVERAIEQLVAGGAFRATLSGRGDGCADLVITVLPSASASSGTAGQSANSSQSTSMSVSTGSSHTLTVRIVIENGTTRASITVA